MKHLILTSIVLVSSLALADGPQNSAKSINCLVLADGIPFPEGRLTVQEAEFAGHPSDKSLLTYTKNYEAAKGNLTVMKDRDDNFSLIVRANQPNANQKVQTFGATVKAGNNLSLMGSIDENVWSISCSSK